MLAVVGFQERKSSTETLYLRAMIFKLSPFWTTYCVAFGATKSESNCVSLAFSADLTPATAVLAIAIGLVSTPGREVLIFNILPKGTEFPLIPFQRLRSATATL